MHELLISKLSNFTLLYVEDEQGTRNNTFSILEQLFKKTYVTHSTKEAYLYYEQYKPDLIITDIKMVEESGIDFIKKIRKTDRQTRVIITSGYTDLEYLIEATELNLIKYIVKPLSEKKLVESLESFINSYKDSKIYFLKEGWLFDEGKSLIKSPLEEFMLTKKETHFLKLLLISKRTITYTEIENIIWEFDENMTLNSMRIFIKNFRKKLPSNYLRTIHNLGYKIN